MKTRLITGIVAGAVFLAFLYFGQYWFSALVLLLSVVGYDEYARMNKLRSKGILYLFGLVLLVLLVLPGIAWGPNNFEAYTWLLLFLLLFLTVATQNKTTIDDISTMFTGVLYMGFGFHYMIASRMLDNGLFWTLLTFVCIWASDSGAYFAGRLFGKRLLWPKISPKKTLEGLAGGILLSIAAALVFASLEPELLTYGYAVMLGATIAVIGTIGDLIQSAYKRVKGIKDTGTILPGHGGVLDRVDSWLIVFPFVHLMSLIPQ
ncbi:phosphatidate cytidylyltransferase [Paenibacillus sp. J31TS4]|uniref:phosphatidate cytidylyltransferase n=1 Tax=Paenibacillus sp. J31TS4 TaxID=2807195 RepID=UPI001B26E399|nr:phosphatidate cytidylyltransferase [Paenibacillus sp. J31TS4]GIP36847.1 phosphatidate cytidylyltransferase [Paenibacillus sp. J31TS4]